MSRIKLDRMIVFDLEETCWDGEPPPGERAEIIEIGVAELLLGQRPSIGRTLSILVKPTSSRVSPFCTSLTGITPVDAKRGRPLREAAATLRRQFGGAQRTWAAWGRDDATLARDFAATGLEPFRMDAFLDLGALWGMLAGNGKALGLRQAMDDLGLEFEGTQHRALPDAINTARVAIELSAVIRARTGRPPGKATRVREL